MYSCGPPLMDVQEWDDQHELTYSSYVRTRVVILKTCRRWWMIGRNGERRSGISAQAARHDDDEYAYINMHILICIIASKSMHPSTGEFIESNSGVGTASRTEPFFWSTRVNGSSSVNNDRMEVWSYCKYSLLFHLQVGLNLQTRTYQLKRCQYNNGDESNSPIIVRDEYYQVLSEKLRYKKKIYAWKYLDQTQRIIVEMPIP